MKLFTSSQGVMRFLSAVGTQGTGCCGPAVADRLLRTGCCGLAVAGTAFGTCSGPPFWNGSWAARSSALQLGRPGGCWIRLMAVVRNG